MAMFPQHGAIYVALMSLVDQGILWTYGMWLCEPLKDNPSVTDEELGERPLSKQAPRAIRIGHRILALLRRFLNPASIGVVLALIIILIGWKVPPIILTPLHIIGAMSTPTSMIYLGGLFAPTKWWEVFKRYEVYVGLGLKMIAFPLLFYILMSALPLPITHEMILMMTIIAGLPTMTAIAMFADKNDNMPEYTTGFVLVTTLFSLISLTLVSALVL